MEKMDKDKNAAAGGYDSFRAYRVDAACWRHACKGDSYSWETPNEMHLRRLDLSTPGASWQWERGSIIKQERRSNMATSAFEWNAGKVTG